MKTRSEKSSINTLNIAQNKRRIPLSDKTNNVSALNNMPPKRNSKIATRQTRKNIGSENKVDNTRKLSDRLKAISPEKSANIIKSKIKDDKSTKKSGPNTKLAKGKNGQDLKELNKNRKLREKSELKCDTEAPLKHLRKTKLNIKENTRNKRLRSNSTNLPNENNKSLINEDINETTKEKNGLKCDTEVPLKHVEKTEQFIKENIENRKISSSSKNVSNENNSKISPQKNKNDAKLELIDEKCLKNPVNKRLLGSFKFTSSENNSDPYEFKFDPKEEPKRKPKKRTRAKKYDSLSDSSTEEDNSMKSIIKNIRKKQQTHLTPVERKLRNRLIKINRTTPQKSEVIPKKCEQNVPEIIHKKSKPNVPARIPEKCVQNVPEVISEPPVKTPEKTVSVVDEINEIANTFLEDDSISTPSRIDIISNLIVRKSRQPPSQVFNSTMIYETPQVIPPRSPWRMELSVIPKKSPILPVKNKSFTPSYTPEIITQSTKKQTTLLGFVNRQPKPDLPVTLFDNNQSLQSRKPFGDLSNSMSPIRQTSPRKTSDDSLFGFTVLSNSEDKENTPVKCKSPTKLKKQSPKIKPVENVQENEVDISMDCNHLFEDLINVQTDKKRYSRQYTRPQTKRKRYVSFKIDSDVEDSDSDTEIHVKKKPKDILSKEEVEEQERLASHYNSYFEEVENYPLCIE